MERSEHLHAALEAARAAAEIIRYYYAGSFAVEVKADRTPVTQADVESERAIRRCLEPRFPDHGFYGEETGSTQRDAEYLWLVDPIDGTKGFVRGYPFFSTQIALMHRGELVLGVSSAPVFGELMWAERGSGAWYASGDDAAAESASARRVGVSEIDRLEDASLSAGNLKTLAGSPHWPAYGELVTRVDRIRGYGDFYHYHLLARGGIDAVVESDVNVLDIAALTVIVAEAGGRMTALDGSPVGLDTTTALASNAALYPALRQALPFGSGV